MLFPRLNQDKITTVLVRTVVDRTKGGGHAVSKIEPRQNQDGSNLDDGGWLVGLREGVLERRGDAFSAKPS